LRFALASYPPSAKRQQDSLRPRERTRTMRARTKLAVGWLLIAAAAVVALWCHWPFLVREHQRLEAWKGVLIWSSEATGALVFLWFGLSHLVLGRPLPQGPDRDTRFDREHIVIIVLFLLGMASDGIVSWWA